MDWWMTEGDREPVGPISTERLLQGIGAGDISKDALVCEVGGTSWKWIGDVAPFSTALDQHRRHRFDPDNEQTPLDPVGQDDFLRRPGGGQEHTMADRSPLRPSAPPPRAWPDRFDDADEKTIVDAVPLRPSEPPTKP